MRTKELLFTLPAHARPKYWTFVMVDEEAHKCLYLEPSGAVTLVTEHEEPEADG